MGGYVDRQGLVGGGDADRQGLVVCVELCR